MHHLSNDAVDDAFGWGLSVGRAGGWLVRHDCNSARTDARTRSPTHTPAIMHTAEGHTAASSQARLPCESARGWALDPLKEKEHSASIPRAPSAGLPGHARHGQALHHRVSREHPHGNPHMYHGVSEVCVVVICGYPLTCAGAMALGADRTVALAACLRPPPRSSGTDMDLKPKSCIRGILAQSHHAPKPSMLLPRNRAPANVIHICAKPNPWPHPPTSYRDVEAALTRGSH